MRAILRAILLRLLAWCTPEFKPREQGLLLLSAPILRGDRARMNWSSPWDFWKQLGIGDTLGVFWEGERVGTGKFTVTRKGFDGEPTLGLSGDKEAFDACQVGVVLKVVDG